MFTLCRSYVNWKAPLQSMVALSFTKAKYITVTKAAKESIWLMGLIEKLKLLYQNGTIYSDNQSLIYLYKNLIFIRGPKYKSEILIHKRLD